MRQHFSRRGRPRVCLCTPAAPPPDSRTVSTRMCFVLAASCNSETGTAAGDKLTTICASSEPNLIVWQPKSYLDAESALISGFRKTCNNPGIIRYVGAITPAKQNAVLEFQTIACGLRRMETDGRYCSRGQTYVLLVYRLCGNQVAPVDCEVRKQNGYGLVLSWHRLVAGDEVVVECSAQE